MNLSTKSGGVGTLCGPKRSSKEKSIRSLLDILEGGPGSAAGAERMIVLIIEVRKSLVGAAWVAQRARGRDQAHGDKHRVALRTSERTNLMAALSSIH